MNPIKRLISAGLLAVMVAGFAIGDSFTTAVSAQNKAADTKVTYQPVTAGQYNIDPAHSLIGFSVEHLEINWVAGRFKDFKGTVNYDDKDITKSSVEFTAKIDSIDTEVEARDTHLKSADFFDAAKFPEMKFVSTKVERKGDDYVLHGNLTIKGVTKPISFDFDMTGAVKDPWGGTRFGIEADTSINRKDFGINYGNALPFGGFDVGDKVDIDLKLEVVKAEPKPAVAE